MNIRKELSKGSSSLLVLSVPRMCMAIGCIWDRKVKAKQKPSFERMNKPKILPEACASGRIFLLR